MSEPNLTAAWDLVFCVFAIGAVGYGLDRWLHTLPLLMFVGLIVGMIAGLWRMAHKASVNK